MMPTSWPLSSTTGKRRTAMLRMCWIASNRPALSFTVVNSGAMMSPTVMTEASSSGAMISMTRSRSVTMPMGILMPLRFSTTNTSPTWFWRISFAASSTLSSDCTVMISLLQTSPIGMAVSFIVGSRAKRSGYKAPCAVQELSRRQDVRQWWGR